MAICDSNKIDSNITGLRYAEEECIGQLPASSPAVAATALLSFTGLPADGDTVTIGARVYTYRTALSTGPTVPNEILIGAAVTNAVANTVAAINGAAGAGTTYSTGTAVHAQVAATSGPGNAVTLTARTAGAAGNAIATTDTGTNLSFGGATMAGGADEDPGTVVWNPLEPNSYTDFGGELTTVARTPINPGRQRKKGVVVDLDASGGFNQDLTTTNAQDLMQGFMFADMRTKGTDTPADYMVTATAGDITLTVTGDFATLESTTLDFTTLGIIPGEWIFIGGDAAVNQFANEENNGFKRVRSVAANEMVLDKSDLPMVADAGTGKQIRFYLGRVLKNEVGALIKRRTYQIERTLGSLDGLDPPQSEYLVGAVPSEAVLNLGTAALVTVDYSFVAVDNEQRTQAEGLKPGARPDLVESDAYNTSSDLHRIRMALAGGADEAPTPLFGFATDLTLTINNTLTANKALGRLGAFDVTAGTFAVSGTLTAYFSDVASVRAVRNNADVTLDMVFVKDNAGLVVDVPLIALGDGRLDVELDQPIMLPLSAEAATAAKIDPNLDHTLLLTFFDTLPNLAAA